MLEKIVKKALLKLVMPLTIAVSINYCAPEPEPEPEFDYCDVFLCGEPSNSEENNGASQENQAPLINLNYVGKEITSRDHSHHYFEGHAEDPEDIDVYIHSIIFGTPENPTKPPSTVVYSVEENKSNGNLDFSIDAYISNDTGMYRITVKVCDDKDACNSAYKDFDSSLELGSCIYEQDIDYCDGVVISDNHPSHGDECCENDVTEEECNSRNGFYNSTACDEIGNCFLDIDYFSCKDQGGYWSDSKQECCIPNLTWDECHIKEGYIYYTAYQALPHDGYSECGDEYY